MPFKPPAGNSGRCRRLALSAFLRIAAPAIALVDFGASAVFASIGTSSPYWSGYVATPGSGQAFANISTTFTIPTLSVRPSSGTDQVGYWVGFDGYNDSTVEQCGIGSTISSSGSTTYYAWYEFYPALSITAPLTVNPGNTIEAEVQYQGESGGNYNYQFTIDDETTGDDFSIIAPTSSNDARDTAEWIAEAPESSGNATTLANFGTVTFSSDVAALNSGGAYNSSDDPNDSLGSLSNTGVELVQNSDLVALPSEIHSSNSFYETSLVNLTWDNAGASSPSDGKTWDIENNNNWNNSSSAAVYVDGSNVTFNDTNNGHYDVTVNTVVSPYDMTVNNSSGNYVFSGSGNIESPGSLTKSGSDTLTIDSVNSFSGGVKVTAGTLVEGVNSALYHASINITGGTVQLGAGTGQSQMTSLSISGSGVFDITNNHFLLSYSSSDPISTIAAYIKSGYNSGNWNGHGIISSTARSKTNGLSYGVGWADGKDDIVSGISSGEIEVKYTLLGDANLDGTVNGSDFSILAANFGSGTTNWDQGNFLFTSAVNGSDFAALAANFGQGDSGADATVTQSDIAALDSFASANGLALPTIGAVPEPAGATLLGLVAMGALSWRTRRSGARSHSV
jgi:autotransporter-associated beta strand protein